MVPEDAMSRERGNYYSYPQMMPMDHNKYQNEVVTIQVQGDTHTLAETNSFLIGLKSPQQEGSHARYLKP